jgi:hypothetical protein
VRSKAGTGKRVEVKPRPVVGVNGPVHAGVVIAVAAAAIGVVAAVIGDAAEVTEVGIEVDVRNARSVVRNAVRNLMFPPASPALSNQLLDPNDRIAVGDGKSRRAKKRVGVTSGRRGRIVRRAASGQVVAMRKAGGEVATTGRSPNVNRRARRLRLQWKKTTPLAKGCGKSLPLPQRASTIPKSASAKQRLRLTNGVRDAGDEAAAAADAKRVSDRNHDATSRPRRRKKPGLSRRKTPLTTDLARAWMLPRRAAGRSRNVLAATNVAVLRAANDPSSRARNPEARVAAVVATVRGGTKKLPVGRSASRDGGAAARSLAATSPPSSRLTTATSRPGTKPSPISIFLAAPAAAVVVDPAEVAGPEAVVDPAEAVGPVEAVGLVGGTAVEEVGAVDAVTEIRAA